MSDLWPSLHAGEAEADEIHLDHDAFNILRRRRSSETSSDKSNRVDNAACQQAHNECGVGSSTVQERSSGESPTAVQTPMSIMNKDSNAETFLGLSKSNDSAKNPSNKDPLMPGSNNNVNANALANSGATNGDARSYTSHTNSAVHGRTGTFDASAAATAASASAQPERFSAPTQSSNSALTTPGDGSFPGAPAQRVPGEGSVLSDTSRGAFSVATPDASLNAPSPAARAASATACAPKAAPEMDATTRESINEANKCNLYFSNLPFCFRSAHLKRLCQPFGDICTFKISYHQQTNQSLRYGFVLFFTSAAAEAAIRDLNMRTIHVYTVAGAAPTSPAAPHGGDSVCSPTYSSSTLGRDSRQASGYAADSSSSGASSDRLEFCVTDTDDTPAFLASNPAVQLVEKSTISVKLAKGGIVPTVAANVLTKTMQQNSNNVTGSGSNRVAGTEAARARQGSNSNGNGNGSSQRRNRSSASFTANNTATNTQRSVHSYSNNGTPTFAHFATGNVTAAPPHVFLSSTYGSSTSTGHSPLVLSSDHAGGDGASLFSAQTSSMSTHHGSSVTSPAAPTPGDRTTFGTRGAAVFAANNASDNDTSATQTSNYAAGVGTVPVSADAAGAFGSNAAQRLPAAHHAGAHRLSIQSNGTLMASDGTNTFPVAPGTALLINGSLYVVSGTANNNTSSGISGLTAITPDTGSVAPQALNVGSGGAAAYMMNTSVNQLSRSDSSRQSEGHLYGDAQQAAVLPGLPGQQQQLHSILQSGAGRGRGETGGSGNPQPARGLTAAQQHFGSGGNAPTPPPTFAATAVNNNNSSTSSSVAAVATSYGGQIPGSVTAMTANGQQVMIIPFVPSHQQQQQQQQVPQQRLQQQQLYFDPNLMMSHHGANDSASRVSSFAGPQSSGVANSAYDSNSGVATLGGTSVISTTALGSSGGCFIPVPLNTDANNNNNSFNANNANPPVPDASRAVPTYLDLSSLHQQGSFSAPFSPFASQHQSNGGGISPYGAVGTGSGTNGNNSLNTPNAFAFTTALQQQQQQWQQCGSRPITAARAGLLPTWAPSPISAEAGNSHIIGGGGAIGGRSRISSTNTGRASFNTVGHSSTRHSTAGMSQHHLGVNIEGSDTEGNSFNNNNNNSQNHPNEESDSAQGVGLVGQSGQWLWTTNDNRGLNDSANSISVTAHNTRGQHHHHSRGGSSLALNRSPEQRGNSKSARWLLADDAAGTPLPKSTFNTPQSGGDSAASGKSSAASVTAGGGGTPRSSTAGDGTRTNSQRKRGGHYTVVSSHNP